MSVLTDQSEDHDMLRIAITAALLVAEFEQELVQMPADCVVDPEAAATAFLLADAGCSIDETIAFMRRERVTN